MQKDAKNLKKKKKTETRARGYSSEVTLQKLSNKYQHDRVSMFFKNLCILELWTKEASALEGLNPFMPSAPHKRCHLDPGYFLTLLWSDG